MSTIVVSANSVQVHLFNKFINDNIVKSLVLAHVSKV